MSVETKPAGKSQLPGRAQGTGQAERHRPPAVRVRPRPRVPLRGRRRRGRARIARRAARGRGRPLRPRAADAHRPPGAQPAERLEAAHDRGPRGAVPARPAGGRPLGDRVALRPRDRLPRPPRDEPGRPAHRSARRGPPRHHLPGRRVRRARRSDSSSAPWWTATAGARPSPRRPCWRRSAATASCTGPPSSIPTGTSETNVGYSTPEHRAAIATHGVSPLHRMSFQSIAYTQLALGLERGRPDRLSRPRTRPVERAPRTAPSTCSKSTSRAPRRVEGDADGVEADVGWMRASVRATEQPFASHQTEPAPLPRIHGLERVNALAATAGDAGLHLAEDEVPLIDGHEVELSVSCAEVDLDQRVSKCPQVGRGEPFAGGSQRPSGVTRAHVDDATGSGQTCVRRGLQARDDIRMSWS